MFHYDFEKKNLSEAAAENVPPEPQENGHLVELTNIKKDRGINHHVNRATIARFAALSRESSSGNIASDGVIIAVFDGICVIVSNYISVDG